MPMRFSAPLTQRRPSPKTIPLLALLEPCRKTVDEVGSSPLDCRTTESAASDAAPEESSRAPPVPCELSQPRPAAPLFPHGQGVASVPSPAQNGAPGGVTGNV